MKTPTLLAAAALAMSMAPFVSLPVLSTFNADLPGAPPATGGANQPSTLVVPAGGSVLVEPSALGIATQPVVVRDDNGDFVSVDWDFPEVPGRIIRMEATFSVNDFITGYFMQTSAAGPVLARLRLALNGDIMASGQVVGTYTPGTPVRVRIDNDIESYTYAVSIDDELDGFADETIHAGLQFLNPGQSAVLGAHTSLNTSNNAGASIAYDDVSITPEWVGQPYCTAATPNSTGEATTLQALGSPSIADNDFVLWAYPVPDNQPFVYFFGPGQGFTPFGNGFLCVTGPITRIQPAGTSVGNVAVRGVDLPAFGIAPGVLNFQCWYRDPAGGGAFFNQSRALNVTFVP